MKNSDRMGFNDDFIVIQKSPIIVDIPIDSGLYEGFFLKNVNGLV